MEAAESLGNFYGGQMAPTNFWESLNSPKFILGPMVDQSDLAFRILCRKYGTDLAYTPMLHSRLFVEDEKYRIRNFQTCDEDSPVIAQFCGDNPEMLGRAAKLIGTSVNAIDLNFGCPQNIAKRGNYGSFLLNQPDLMEKLVESVVREGVVPVTCKMRKVEKNDLQSTINLARRLEQAGCSALCLHGRTKEEKGQFYKEADWDSIAIVKKCLNIPVIANGGIENKAQALKCLEFTGADAVMSAEAILEYPAIFNDTPVDIDKLVDEYIQLAMRFNTPIKIVRAHFFHSLYGGLQRFTDLRTEVAKANTFEEFRNILVQLKEKRKDVAAADKLGWYNRYRNPINVNQKRQKNVFLEEHQIKRAKNELIEASAG